MKIYNLNNIKELKASEKYKTMIENKGKKPLIKTIGFDKISIEEV